MDVFGIIFGATLGLLYPLVIWLLIKKVRFEQEPYRYLFAAFILGFAVGPLAYIGIIVTQWSLSAMSIQGLAAGGVSYAAGDFYQEAAKLLVLVIPFIRRRMDERNGAFYGLVVGLGFGSVEHFYALYSFAASYYPAQLTFFTDLMLLSNLATLPLTPETLLVSYFVLPQLIFQITSLLPLLLLYFGPSLLGLPLGQVYEGIIAIPFHASWAAIIGYGLVRGKTLKYYLVAVILHDIANFIAILYGLGLMGFLTKEAISTVFSVALFVYVLYKTVWTVKPLEQKISKDRAGKA